MKINKCQQSFGAMTISANALKVMSDRMPSGQFCDISENLIKMYKKSPFNILLYTRNDKSKFLNAMVTFENDILIQREEPLLDRIFKNPKKFLESLCDEIDYQEVLFFGKRSRTGR